MGTPVPLSNPDQVERMRIPTEDLLRSLAEEAERIQEDCVYNYMGHYQAAVRWEHIDHALGFPVAILSCIAAFTAFPLPAVATGLSVVTTLLALCILYFRPAERAATHFRCGGKFKGLREKTRLFHEIELQASQIDEGLLTRRIRELSEEKRVLSELGVPIPDFAYRSAKAKIAAGQASYDVDQRKLLEP
jgi:hypothetical protein